MIRMAIVLIALGVTGCNSAWHDCSHTASRDLDLDAAGIDALVVAARAGDLDIQGEPGLQRVVVSGKACASSTEYLDQIRLVERRDGNRLTVAVELPETGGWGGNSWLDLELRVPESLALTVTDSSGDAVIGNVASADVDDSSGDLRIENIAGDVRIDDSSGDIAIRVVGSLVVASDGSGDIEAEDIRGNVLIEDDGSGDIRLSRVGGDAVVENDSSGDIGFVDIGGTARVGDDGSGSIEADDIGRDFIVDRDGSGGIHHNAVKGAVRIPADD